MREVLDAPDRRLEGSVLELRVAGLRVQRAQVEDVELALERRADDLVHDDVSAVELEPADAVLDVDLVEEDVRLQVEPFQVAVVVAGRDHPLVVIVAVAESDFAQVSKKRGI